MNDSRPNSNLRVDLLSIAQMIEPDSRVLDIGCGDGDLLAYLSHERGVDARGIELSQKGVNACVARGLSVVQGDADTDLADYPTGAFDFVILSQTLQATRRPREVVEQMLRIGRRAAVSFPNFGHWRVRLKLLGSGRMPVTRTLPATWYDTDNIHLCTIRDFHDLCREMNVEIEAIYAVGRSGTLRRWQSLSLSFSNLFASAGLFVLRRRDPAEKSRARNAGPEIPGQKSQTRNR